MTVTYTDKVATSNFSCFLKLLLRWRGSIYKLVWKDFAIFVLAYFILSFVYRFALDPYQQEIFEMIAIYCEKYNNLIPVAFVLGFFVTLVIGRWWNQFLCIPFPDRMALYVIATIQGHDDRGRLMRRTIMRYLCLSFVMIMASIAPAAKKRFPTFQHLTDAGFMLPNEQKIVEAMKIPFNRYFMPLAWATTLVARARKEGRIKDDFAVKSLTDEICNFRGMLAMLFNYDWISIPLVYTQVVTLAVYTFFLSCLMGRQMVKSHSPQTADIFFPVFTFLQFFFYMGWLKVGESLINPFGEDDDDYEVNSLIDRHLRMSYIIVDEMHSEHPELIKDQYWDDLEFQLPYTAASQLYKVSEEHIGSAANIVVPEQQTEFLNLSVVIEDAVAEANENDERLPTRTLTAAEQSAECSLDQEHEVLVGTESATKNHSRRKSIGKHWKASSRPSLAMSRRGSVESTLSNGLEMKDLRSERSSKTALNSTVAGSSVARSHVKMGSEPIRVPAARRNGSSFVMPVGEDDGRSLLKSWQSTAGGYCRHSSIVDADNPSEEVQCRTSNMLDCSLDPATQSPTGTAAATFQLGSYVPTGGFEAASLAMRRVSTAGTDLHGIIQRILSASVQTCGSSSIPLASFQAAAPPTPTSAQLVTSRRLSPRLEAVQNGFTYPAELRSPASPDRTLSADMDTGFNGNYPNGTGCRNFSVKDFSGVPIVLMGKPPVTMNVVPAHSPGSYGDVMDHVEAIRMIIGVANSEEVAETSTSSSPMTDGKAIMEQLETIREIPDPSPLRRDEAFHHLCQPSSERLLITSSVGKQ